MNEDNSSFNGELKILEAKKVTKDAIELMRKPNKTIDDLYEILIRYFNDETLIHTLVDELLNKEANGADPLQDRAFMDQFTKYAITEFKSRIDDLDSLSKLASMARETNRSLDDISLYADDIIILGLKKRGGFGIVTGVPGSGKTDMSLLMAEKLISQGFHIVTNIHVTSSNDKITVTQKASIAIKAMIQNPPSILILDEGGLYWSRQDAPKAAAQDLVRLAKIIRKFRGNILLIDQLRKTVPSAMIELAGTQIYKSSKKIASVNIKLDRGGFHRTLKGIPKSGLSFDTLDIAYFDFDIKLNQLLEYMSNNPDMDQGSAILDFLETEFSKSDTEEKSSDEIIPDPEKLKKESVKAIICRIKDQKANGDPRYKDLSDEDIGELYDITGRTVRTWYKEYQIRKEGKEA